MDRPARVAPALESPAKPAEQHREPGEPRVAKLPSTQPLYPYAASCLLSSTSSESTVPNPLCAREPTMRTFSQLRMSVVLLALPVLAGCSGGLGNLGAIGDILGAGMPGGGPQQGQLAAEVQQVDTQRQLIQVRTEDGQSGSVRFDQNTQVVYQQQQYPVTALERGDVVVMQIQQDSQGNLYASRVDVRQSVQERTGQGSTGAGQLQQVAGQVRQIDRDRGLFELQTQYGAVTVSLPFNASQAAVQYFNRLRTGDSVRLEGTPLGNGRIELYRFL